MGQIVISGLSDKLSLDLYAVVILIGAALHYIADINPVFCFNNAQRILREKKIVGVHEVDLVAVS